MFILIIYAQPHTAGFVLALALLHVLLFTLFSFPAVILNGRSFHRFLRRNARLLKRKMENALWLLSCILAFLLFALIGFILMVLILGHK